MKHILLLLFLLNIPFTALAEEKEEEKNDFDIGSLAYLQYKARYKYEKFDNNRFQVSRAYLTFRKELFVFLDFRITLDVYDDDDGVEERLKYLYAKFNFNDIGFITSPYIKFGIAHTPWLDFEEHINIYRMQGTMFMERQHIMNSSDFGAVMQGNFGGEMGKKYKENVNDHFAGKYGTYAIGVYNGSGYHNLEQNANKVFQGRVTLRPLPEIIPGLQFSYFGLIGKGSVNKEFDKSPDWQTNLIFASYESKYINVTAQTLFGKGDKLGKLVDDNGEPLEYSGYSLFAEGKIYKGLRIFSRFDIFDPNTNSGNNLENRLIIGAGYDFGNRNILLIDYDHKFFKSDEISDERFLKLTMQVHI